MNNSRSYKKVRHRIILCCFSLVCFCLILGIVQFICSFQIVRNYIDCRYNFTSSNIEEQFAKRYSLFSDDLYRTIDIDEQNKTKETIKSMNLTSKVVTTELLDIDLSITTHTYTLYLKAGYYSDSVLTNPYDYEFTITLTQQKPFIFKIANVELIEHDSNHADHVH